jgi:hypothetical protein
MEKIKSKWNNFKEKVKTIERPKLPKINIKWPKMPNIKIDIAKYIPEMPSINIPLPEPIEKLR